MIAGDGRAARAFGPRLQNERQLGPRKKVGQSAGMRTMPMSVLMRLYAAYAAYTSRAPSMTWRLAFERTTMTFLQVSLSSITRNVRWLYNLLERFHQEHSTLFQNPFDMTQNDDSWRYQSQTIGRVIQWLLLIAFLMLVLVGCSRRLEIDQNNTVTVSTPAPPATKAVVVTRLAALAVGHITYQHGCLFLVGLDGSQRTLAWPPDFHPVVHPDSGYVEITLPNNKRVEIRLNDQPVNLGGGNVAELHDSEYDVIDKSMGTERCPSPYWLVGDIEPQP